MRGDRDRRSWKQSVVSHGTDWKIFDFLSLFLSLSQLFKQRISPDASVSQPDCLEIARRSRKHKPNDIWCTSGNRPSRESTSTSGNFIFGLVKYTWYRCGARRARPRFKYYFACERRYWLYESTHGRLLVVVVNNARKLDSCESSDIDIHEHLDRFLHGVSHNWAATF